METEVVIAIAVVIGVLFYIIGWLHGEAKKRKEIKTLYDAGLHEGPEKGNIKPHSDEPKGEPPPAPPAPPSPIADCCNYPTGWMVIDKEREAAREKRASIYHLIHYERRAMSEHEYKTLMDSLYPHKNLLTKEPVDHPVEYSPEYLTAKRFVDFKKRDGLEKFKEAFMTINELRAKYGHMPLQYTNQGRIKIRKMNKQDKRY